MKSLQLNTVRHGGWSWRNHQFITQHFYGDGVEDENLKIILDAVRHKYDAVADVDNSLNGGFGDVAWLRITLIIGSHLLRSIIKMGQTTIAILGLVLLGFLLHAACGTVFTKKIIFISFSITKARQYAGGRPENCFFI